ncbi:MAG: SOS response-associated peptidase [Xanthobacteraceae bacterium]|jgi:putative SOS response-associated peptidase YedK
MCGRAKLPDDVSEIKLDLKIDWDEIGDYQPRWNAAPTSNLPVVTSNNGERTLTLMRWGLVPAWAKDLKIGYSTFNARAEGLDTRPTFRSAWQAGRRCLVIADGYYEWRSADKQPFAVSLSNRGPMTFAGLWDLWRAPDGGVVKSFAIVTTAANALLAPLHDRMPVLLAPDRWPCWLGEKAATSDELKTMLKPYPGAAMAFWPVDRRVGNVRNDSPDLFEPIPAPIKQPTGPLV